MGRGEKYGYRVLGGGGHHKSSTTTTGNKRGSNKETTTTTTTTSTVPSGCMRGVFHLFDFHHFQFSALNHQLVCFKPTNNVDSFIQEEEEEQQQQTNITNIKVKGVEAPRNSLESEESLIMGGADETLLHSSSEMKEEDFVFPVGIRVHTKVAHEGTSDFSSSESSNSPCIKTPNLVARLMGLDLLPEALSPSPSSACSSIQARSNKTHHGNHLQESINASFGSRHQLLRTRHNDVAGLGSLPDTPRISSARRSDVDPSRLSLQINKENMIDELEYFSARSSVDSVRSLSSSYLKKARTREWKSEETESRSPSHYARQIVKQVKESVSRKMGRDITNLTNNNSNNRTAKPIEKETQTVPKTKKTSRLNRTGDDSTPSCSPRLRFMETKTNTKPVSTSQDQNSNLNLSPNPISKPRLISPAPPQPPLPRPPPPPPQVKARAKPKAQPLPQHQTIEKCKKASCERFTQVRTSPASKKANLNLPSEHKKCKKTSQLSKDLSVSPSPTPIPTSLKQSSKPISQFSQTSSIRVSYDYHHHRADKFTGSVAEFRYVSRILKCTGIEQNTYVSITRWFSPSHPLDPSIFHHLEESFFPTGSLKCRSNRRLIFNLVDEILVEILRPYLNMKPWIKTNNKMLKNKLMRGDELLQQIWLEIQNSPLANCEILQDIDALIEKDLPQDDANMRTLPVFEEGESIVLEIEKDLLDSLVHELALSAFFIN